ncbi:XKR6 [Cordylochernes scorpioides]|uniref:XK-related protein n=1 Tax=Cordylochernes scorpioides TaxID=51811 RepID=A0ABY6K4R1_9ARAC|nr:XKR6 [Cordylochernes scorpioides]
MDAKHACWCAVIGEVVASGFTLFSLLQAVSRKDDGPMTGFFSWIGWTLLFVSRVIALSMGACIIHGWILIPTVAHALGMTFWIYCLALESHEGREVRKFQIFLLSFGLFGAPSLLYWPIMFQLKTNYRPFKYLLLILIENSICILLWYFLSESKVSLVLLGIVVLSSIIGVLFIVFYISCKPKYSETVALHDMRVKNAESFGIYFDFCNTLFYLPRKQWVEDALEKVQQQQTF